MSSACQIRFNNHTASSLKSTKGKLSTLILLIGGSLLAAGCNTTGLYPVTGMVVDASGKPIPGLEKSNYILFAQVPDGISSSMGDIEADGSFKLFTNRPGDGVPPGEYYVYLPRKHQNPERTMPQVVSGKF